MHRKNMEMQRREIAENIGKGQLPGTGLALTHGDLESLDEGMSRIRNAQEQLQSLISGLTREPVRFGTDRSCDPVGHGVCGVPAATSMGDPRWEPHSDTRGAEFDCSANPCLVAKAPADVSCSDCESDCDLCWCGARRDVGGLQGERRP